MTERRIEAVFFDLGDTLIYFDDDWPEIFRLARLELVKSLNHAGIKVDNQFLERFTTRMMDYYRERDTEFIEYTTFNILTSTLAEQGYQDLPEETILASLADMHAITQSHWIPEDDALPTLEKLRSDGYRLGLISNAADDPNTQTLVDKLGAREYFDLIISSAAAGIRKPNPRIFQIGLESMNLTPNRAVMVGDTLGADILGAKHAGIFSIWLTRRANTAANRAHIDTIFPDARIAKLSELPGLLDKIN